MGNDRRESLRETFDEAAGLYDRARPGYPDELFADLFEIGGLGPEATIVEIGCGTGQASAPLARRSGRLVCVELGEHLADLARRNLVPFPHAEVVTAPFETWDAQRMTFDVVFAATSWHWLDPRVRFAKAARLLRPEGFLAIVTTRHVSPEDADPFFREIEEVYAALGDGTGGGAPRRPEDVADERGEIEREGLFEDVRIRRYLWTVDYTAESYLDLLDTYSDHRTMEPSKRGRLYEEIRRRIDARPHARVRKHYLAILHVARLTGG